MLARFTPAGAACVAAAVLAGCRSYTPRPLDMPAHLESWAQRTPESESVAAYAARLGAESGGGEGGEFDPSDGLSLAEAEAVAMVFNPDLRIARLRAEAARVGAEHAGRWEDPEIGVDVERVIQGVPEPWVVGSMLNLTIPISGRLEAEKAMAGAEHAAELARLAGEEWGARIAVRRAWLEWTARSERLRLAREYTSGLEGIVGIAGHLLSAGVMSRVEERLFRIEQASRRNELAQLESQAAEAELALKGLLGLSPGAPVRFVPTALAAEVESGDDAGLLHERSPALAVLRAEYAAAEEALKVEIREQYPDITIGGGYGTEEGDDRVLFGLSLPVPLWNRNQEGVARAEAQREVARAMVETAYERALGELAAARTRLHAAGIARRTLEEQIVPMVDEQYAAARRVAELGEVDALLLLESLTRQYETKGALIDARLAEAEAAVRIAELIGPSPATEAEDER